MTRTPLISVIVPVYKVEKYLNRCLQSIVNQTYEELEIILVDDGSPDSCPKMCEVWRKRDSRIKVIHKKNGGLSDARNVGLMNANGELISFIDSDDYVKTGMYQTMVTIMHNEDADIVECGVLKVRDGEEPEIEQKKSIITCYDTLSALTCLIQEKDLQQTVWNKLYRRALIKGIGFPKGKLNEDEFWTYQAFGRANRIVKTTGIFYYYVQRSGSIMDESYSLRRLDGIEAKRNRQKYIEANHSQLAVIARSNLFYSCIYAQQMTYRYLSGNDLIIANRLIRNTISSILKKEIAAEDLKQILWLRLEKVSYLAACRIRNLLHIGF